MTLKVEFRSEAEQELIQAFNWYEERNTSGADQFEDSISNVINQISKSPSISLIWKSQFKSRCSKIPLLYPISSFK